MTESNTKSKIENQEVLIFLANSLIFTTFLFYIDEGYYNFDWVTNIGNWILFVIYSLIIFAVLLFSSKIILKKYKGKSKILLSIIVGIVLVISILTSIIISI